MKVFVTTLEGAGVFCTPAPFLLSSVRSGVLPLSAPFKWLRKAYENRRMEECTREGLNEAC